ncbi:response regulator transcription factor [Pseudoalteromonas phenolica]|uniref:response regulator transcription factor n=1 Tax=Pseudoalteromonas phenolica TaxID=161398 RepID=UPI00384D6204
MFLGCTEELSSILKAIELLKTSIKDRSFNLNIFEEVMFFAEKEELYVALIDKSNRSVKADYAIAYSPNLQQQLQKNISCNKLNNVNLLKSYAKARNPLSDIATYDLDNQDSGFATLVAFNNKRTNTSAPASYLIELILPYLHKAQLFRYESMRAYNSPIHLLTDREKEVLNWISSGKTNGEIGMILGISQYTVKNHVAKILEKLNAPNRSAAMALNNELNIIE